MPGQLLSPVGTVSWQKNQAETHEYRDLKPLGLEFMVTGPAEEIEARMFFQLAFKK